MSTTPRLHWLDFKAAKTGEFDQACMNVFYDYTYQQAESGHTWRKTAAQP